MIKRFEQFSSAFSSIYRYIQKIEREEMEKHGLKGAFAQYLMALHRHPDGMTASQLCEACDMNKAAVSRAIGEMEEAGLVCKKSESETSYRAPLFLTERGREIVQFVYERGIAAVSRVGGALSEEERNTFYAVLEIIETNLQKLCQEGLPETK
ncbi:MAG: MarR family transcriptional regulator [Clostridia bacterium]|nr:MarR family transcriptional regulator [Clostridia bacterium]